MGVSVQGSEVTYTGKAVGSATVTVTAKDGRGGTAKQEFLVTVNRANRPPETDDDIPDQRVQLGSTGRVDLSDYFSDPDKDPLTYEASTVASAVARVWVDGSTVRFRGLRVGDATVKVTARDPSRAAASQEFDVEVYKPAQECAITRVGTGNFKVREDATAVGEVRVDASDCGTLDYELSGTGASDVSAAAVSESDDDAAITGSFNFEGRSSYDLTLTVSERGGTASKSGRVRITVTDVNEAPRPSGSIGSQTVRVGQPVSLNVTGYFTDEDAGDVLTFASRSSATGRLTVNAAGSPVRLTGVTAGGATVTVTARDRGGLTATQTIAVTVVPATTRCGITVSGGSLSVPEDAGAGTDVDGKLTVTATSACGTLSYALAGTGAGDFSVSAAGASDDDAKLKVAGTLDHETRTSYALKLTVSSGTVSATGDVSISVTDVNEAPEIESAIPARPMETGDSEPVVVSPHFSDPDNDPLTYLAASSNREVATVSVSGSTVSVKGVAKGRADVTVTARDPGGKTASQSFRVTVTDPVPGNRAPVFGSAAFERSVAENSPGGAAVGDPVTAADPDGDTLSYALASGGDAGLFGIGASTGRITVAAGASLDHETTATHSVSVVASDGTLADTAAVTIKVTDVPPPGRPAKPVVTGGDGQVTAMWKAPSNTGPAITGYDVRHRAASASGWTEASLGVVLEHTVTGLPAGTDHLVQVRAVSPEGAGEWSESGEGTTAAAANRAPAFASTAFERSVPEHSPAGTAVGAPVTATDVDGDTLSYALASGGDAALFAVGPRTGQLTVATDAVLDYEITATHSVSVVASDGALADTAKVTIRLTDVPPPGRLRKPFMRGAQGKVTATWTAPSNAGPAITGYDLGYRRDSAGGDWAEVSLGDVLKHAVTGLPAGTLYRVRLRAVSAEGAGAWSEPGRTGTSPRFDPASVTRSVPENSAAGTAVGAPVTAAAEEGVVLSYDFGGDGPPEFVIDGSSGQLKVAEGASLDYERGKRTYAVTVVAGYVADGDELADVAHVKIRVTDVPAPDKPDAPTVTGGTEQVTVSWSAPENEGPAITAYDLRYRAKGGGAWTDVSALGAVLADTIPGLEAGTTYEVQVRAISSEGTGAWSESGEGTTEAANRAPAFGVETYEREVPENSAAGTTVGDPVTATDEDGDDLTYSLISGEDGAPFEIDGTTGRITVASGETLDYESGNTVYTVSVRATDGTLADTAAVMIRVTDVAAPGQPDAPTVTGGTEQVAVSWIAPANEGPAITGYDLRYRAKGGREWTVPPSVGAVLSRTITGLEAETTYSVQVRAVSSEGAGEWSDSGEGTTDTPNRAPSFGAETHEREAPENSAAGTAVGDPVTATDEDGDDLTYSFVSGEDDPPFEIDGTTGQITVAEGAALDYESGNTVYTLNAQATDGTLADTAAVTIRVTDVPAPGQPDAPTVTGGTEQVAVSWIAPANEGPEITGYDLRYRAKGGGKWTDVSALGAVLSRTIAGLEGETTYQVQVRAISSEGAGEWSDSGEGTTEAANRAPSFGAETHEREVPENSAADTAVGDPVTATDEDGDDLTYSLVSGDDGAPFEIDGTTGQITLASGAALDYESGNTIYAVSVRATDGTLADTAAVTIRVTDVPAPGQPNAPTVTGGTEQVAVSWSAPANEGPAITGYEIRYRSKADSAWTVPASLGVVLSSTISDLDSGTTYEVQVRAVSSEGAGEWSDSGEGTTEAANRAPSFGEETYERSVPENSAAGTAVGDPVTATDEDGDDLTYSLISGEDGVPFEVDASTGRITVAADSALNYERGDTLFTLSIEASDGELAATAPVAIRVTNADDPGSVALSPETARVGVEMTATLMDEDGVRSAGRKRRWQRSRNGNSWNDIGTGRMYNPVAGDAGRWLRVVFTYSDRHGPDKRAVSDSVRVLAANATPAFGKDAYERSVPENSAGGTRVGKPVTATDEDGDDLDYVILGEGDGAPFEIDSGTGRIKVAAEATLNYESGDTLFTVRVEATDGELADTASVTIRVKDADDPGEVSLSPGVARVGVELAATLTDEDGVRSAGRKRRWQRSANGNSWTEIATGGAYNPVAADEGRWLRAVFTYRDGHGPGKRAVSDPVKVLPANAKPSFGAAYEREVPENSPGGTKVGAPVAATDPNSPSLSYSLTGDGDDAPFGIDSSTGQITVAEGAALDHESADTLFTVRVEASDGDLADTASVKIRVTNADDPGTIALSADVARVGERLTATLMDEDRSIERSKMRTWQRSPDGATWTMVVQGAQRRFYTPTEADRGKYLRAVFTYTDGHGPGKRAESRAVMVVGATTPVVSFGAGSYTVAAGGSADVGLLLSPAASSALAIKVVAGSSTHTATFQSGAGTASVAIGTTGLSAHDTLAVRFGDLPDGVAVGVPATTRIVVAAVAGDRVSRSVVEDGSPTELEVEYAQAEYAAVAGGPGTEIVLRASPAADRRVAVPITASSEASMEPMLPDSVVFEPGDSLAAFTLEVPAGAEPGLLALGFGALPEAVSAGGVASATVAIADHGPGPLLDGAFDLGLAVLGRAVAEGARQAVGARIDAVMRPMGSGSSKGVPGSASGWAERAAGTLASLTGALLNASSAADMARRSGSVDLPTGREAVRRLLPSLSFATALGPQSAEGRPGIGLWAEGSAQSFRGDPGIDYDGGLRALTVGADARIGSSALLGVSLVRSDGDLDYDHRSTQGSLGHAMNSVHPYVFLQPSPGIGLWAMAGYGSGDVRDGDHHGDPGASLRMLSGGVKVPLARSGAFGLALNGDAFTVGMSTDDGGREGSASRARALLEASWTAGGLKLATQAGARYDGGDADTGGGAETGASVGYAAHGLDLDLRGRLALGSGRHREWGAALRLAFDPGTRGEGFRLAVSPRHGHDRSGIHGLMREGTLHAMTPATGRDWRLDAEAGYGIKNSGAGGALDGYTRLSADGRNRSWSFGSRYSVSQTFRLGIEGSRNQLPGQDPDIGIRVALDFTF